MTSTESRPERTLLPLTPVDRLGTGPACGGVGSSTRTSRAAMTCLFRCGNACDHPEPNRTDHGHVQDEIAKVVARRAVVAGGAAAALVASTGLASGAAAAEGRPGKGKPGGKGKGKGKPGKGADEPVRRGDLARTDFRSVTPNRRDAVTTAQGFTSSVVMRWGDPVVAGAPVFGVRRQSVAAARTQFGYNCDYVGVLPISRDNALLVVNHEYTDENLMFPTGAYTPAEVKAIAMSNHGMSVVEIRKGRVRGSWNRVSNLRKARYNRRLHIATGFRLDGPAAGDPRLRTTADPKGTLVRGTLNNCSGGTTPWGTVLSGEENINQYFDASGALDARYAEGYQRYGITGAGKGWSEVERRFDLTAEPHEPHRFGWVVEVDPLRPKEAPRKHTMLGRFKHEGANIVIAKNGRAVAYMGDDERGDYLYKFVSAATYDPRRSNKARRRNKELLSRGTLYVARLRGDGTGDGRFDGTGTWLPLCTDTRSFVPGMSVADVLIFTRLAADKVAPTKMDRPEDVEPNLVTGKVYAALTNNSNRGSATIPVDEANPVGSSMVRSAPGAPLTRASGNRNGYVLEMTPGRGDHTATSFTWDLMLVCGDPEAAETYFGGFDKAQVSPISCPDNLTFDSVGNLWISTDGNALGANDGIFRVPTRGPERGRVQQFITMPRGAEACGPLIADDDRSLFFAVQHPGEMDGATFEEPFSTWPHTDDFPRPAVGVAYRRR